MIGMLPRRQRTYIVSDAGDARLGWKGPPPAEQAAEIAGLQSRLDTLDAVSATLLLIALIAMAAAQYFLL